MSDISTLTFERSEVADQNGSRSFLDFVVDGTSVQERVLAARDMITPFGGWPRQLRTDYVRWLMRGTASNMPWGRVPLYVCSYCGDVGCGAVVVRVTVERDTVVWSEFAREVTYSIEQPGDCDELYSDVPMVRFDKPGYDEAISDALRHSPQT